MKNSALPLIAARKSKPEMRDRDFARAAGITEAELAAAYCAAGEAKQIRIDVATLLDHAAGLGTVMALTRNASAVHETIGQFGRVFPGKTVSMTLGEIDLRIFHAQWGFGFARDVEIQGIQRKSLHFFDHEGMAVFKLYEQEGGNRQAWATLIDSLAQEQQPGDMTIAPKQPEQQGVRPAPDIAALQDKWRAMSDVHQLHGILRELQISRYDAVRMIGQDFAHELAHDALALMLQQAVHHDIPIMCFVGNRGCIQIYTGTVGPVKMYGPWLNLLDSRFHLHVHMPDIDSVWCVRKPTKDGVLHSLEIFDKQGNMMIQFFGERKEGRPEREAWRAIMQSLPASAGVTASKNDY